MGGVESWDRLDGNSRLSLDGHTFHSLVCSVSSVQTSCIWPTPVSVAFHLPACGYTCSIERGSRYFGGKYLGGILSGCRTKMLLLLLPLFVTASQGPLPPDFEEASWQKVGIKLLFGRLGEILFWLKSTGCWKLFCNFNPIIVGRSPWIPKEGKGPSG